MTLSVFCTWRSTRKDKVSNPCKSKKALNGEIQAPKSRSKMARTLSDKSELSCSFSERNSMITRISFD